MVTDTPIEIFFFKKFYVFTPSENTFGTPNKNFFSFFALIEKIFLQTLVEIFVRYHENLFFKFLGPPGTPQQPKKKEKRKFHIWSVGYQNRVKRVGGVHF